MKEIPLPKNDKNLKINIKKAKVHTKDAFIWLEYSRLGCLKRMSSEYEDLTDMGCPFVCCEYVLLLLVGK